MKVLYPYLLFVLAAFLSIETNAQNQPIDSSISVRQTKVYIKGNKLYLNFDIYINQPKIRSNQGIVLTPVLQSSDMNRTFPEVIINRKNRNISYNRTIGEITETESYRKPYTVVKTKKRSQIIIPYQAEVPFEVWMENSDLLLQENIHCCRNMTQKISTQTLAQNIGVIPLLTYIYPKIKSFKNRQDSVISVLHFPQSITTILPGFRQNKQNITKAESVLTDKNLIVISIHIVGAASLDGSYQFNEQLSKERAFSLSSFFANHDNVSDRLEKIDWIGENWNSLLEIVEQSNMQYKQEVIDVIKKTDVFSERKNILMKLKSGNPYQYMLVHFFSDLRSASYTIHYKTIPFDMTKGRELIFSAPQTLGVDEMLFVTDSFSLGSPEYKSVTDIAAKTYLKNMILNTNTSSAALCTGNTAEAKQYLLRFGQQPKSWNNLGAVYMLDRNDELARKYFQKAIDSGSVNAFRNMKKLNYRKKNP